MCYDLSAKFSCNLNRDEICDFILYVIVIINDSMSECWNWYLQASNENDIIFDYSWQNSNSNVLGLSTELPKFTTFYQYFRFICKICRRYAFDLIVCPVRMPLSHSNSYAQDGTSWYKKLDDNYQASPEIRQGWDPPLLHKHLQLGWLHP